MAMLQNDLKFHQLVANKFLRISRWIDGSQIGLNKSNLVRLYRLTTMRGAYGRRSSTINGLSSAKRPSRVLSN